MHFTTFKDGEFEALKEALTKHLLEIFDKVTYMDNNLPAVYLEFNCNIGQLSSYYIQTYQIYNTDKWIKYMRNGTMKEHFTIDIRRLLVLIKYRNPELYVKRFGNH